MKNDLKKRLTAPPARLEEPQPVFFKLTEDADQAAIAALLAREPQTRIIDTYESQLREYFILQNPPLNFDPPQQKKKFKEFCEEHYGQNEPWQAGTWVYLAWRHILLHLLDDEPYQVVRTGRNRNLITAEEQKKFYNSTIGIAGLSVGNSVALSIVLTGGGKHLKLADPDTLELTNLNRIRGSIAELTEPKVYMAARQIYELDPYADLKLYTDGLTEENIDEFFDDQKLDIMIDEIDNLGMKIRLRQESKKRRLPVLMAADNGESGLLDIERYDLDENIEPFHGRAGADIAERVVGKKLPLPVIGKIIGEELIGLDVLEPRVKTSLLEIGRSIPTWPQLGGAAALNGVAVAVAARKIITNQPLVDNRAVVSLASLLIPGYDDPEQVEARRSETKEFQEKYNEAVKRAGG